MGEEYIEMAMQMHCDDVDWIALAQDLSSGIRC
jgi:hypothetical protein